MDNEDHAARYSHTQLSNAALAAAKEAAREVLTETFALLGVNVGNFESMQAFRDDLEMLHTMRTASGVVRAKFFLVFVSVIATAAAVRVIDYVWSLFPHH